MTFPKNRIQRQMRTTLRQTLKPFLWKMWIMRRQTMLTKFLFRQQKGKTLITQIKRPKRRQRK